MKRLLTRLVAVACLSFATLPAAAEQATARRPSAGRALADVLRDLQARGLRVVFSSEVVRKSMRVAAEPRSIADRQILDEILKPHGLEARPGPSGTLIVVPGAVRDASSARRPPAGATIRGMVVDARSATPLPGVLVRISADPENELITDGNGRFEMTGVPAGTHTLFASLVGYSFGRPSIEVGKDGVLDLTIALADGTATYFEQITVTADRFRPAEHNVPSAMVLNSADLLALRGVLADDPLRAVQALPSVSAGNDFRSEFSVRGADYRHVGLSVDGMTTDWPIHTVRDDASGGSVSLINSDVVDRVTLLAGAYPQDRPARTGAWVDFTLREGSRARTQVRGAVSMTSASLIFEGPIGATPRGSWLVAMRQSYVQWILRRMGSSDGTAFGFSDIQGKGVYDLTPNQRVDATVIAGRSQLDMRRRTDDPNLVGRGNADAVLLTTGWRASRGSALTLTQRASLSRYGFDNARIDTVPLANGTGSSVAYRGAVSWAPAPSALLRFGTHVQRDSAERTATRFIEHLDPPAAVPRLERVDGARYLWSVDARGSYSSDRVTIEGGALVSRASNDRAPAAASPWFGVTFPLGTATSLRAGGGMYRQHAALDQTAGTFGGEDVGAERARHAEIALERRWSSNTRVQVAAYDRRERDVLRLADNEYRSIGGGVATPSMTPRWRNVLDGSASGVEMLVQRRAANGLSGWVSYAYSRTRYNDRRTAETFDADFDQRHAVSVYTHYRLSPVTSLGMKLRTASNVPIPGYLDARAGGLYVGERRNTVRLRPYGRLDLRADRVFGFDGRRLTLFVEVVNVLGRTNYAPGYDAMRVDATGRVFSTSQRLFPFLPSAGILVEF